jgi:hypothetical protein
MQGLTTAEEALRVSADLESTIMDEAAAGPGPDAAGSP